MSLAGGIMGNGYQCGMLWGAALAAGAQAYRLFGPGPQAQVAALLASQRLVESFRVRAKEINCAEITEMEWKTTSKRRMTTQVVKFFAKGGPIGCFRLAADYAHIAFGEIEAALSAKPPEAPPYPVSCAALLAHKMGLSDLQATMAAGFAGGIGLSGGACGALGVAIWIVGLNSGKEGGKKSEMYPPEAGAVVDSFLKLTDYEFECAKIAGRKFEHVADHACYLREGGCSKIIQALATNSWEIGMNSLI